MGIFDDILGEIDNFDEPVMEEDAGLDHDFSTKKVGVSEVEKKTNIWNSKDNGKAWKVDNVGQGWTSISDVDQDADIYDDDDDDDDYEEDDDFEDDEEDVFIVPHHSVFNI